MLQSIFLTILLPIPSHVPTCQTPQRHPVDFIPQTFHGLWRYICVMGDWSSGIPSILLILSTTRTQVITFGGWHIGGSQQIGVLIEQTHGWKEEWEKKYRVTEGMDEWMSQVNEWTVRWVSKWMSVQKLDFPQVAWEWVRDMPFFDGRGVGGLVSMGPNLVCNQCFWNCICNSSYLAICLNLLPLNF